MCPTPILDSRLAIGVRHVPSFFGATVEQVGPHDTAFHDRPTNRDGRGRRGRDGVPSRPHVSAPGRKGLDVSRHGARRVTACVGADVSITFVAELPLLVV